MSQERIPYEVKDSFYEELEHTFDKFPKYHKTILLDFNVKFAGKTFSNQQL
jgi:hypothetical protein